MRDFKAEFDAVSRRLMVALEKAMAAENAAKDFAFEIGRITDDIIAENEQLRTKCDKTPKAESA